MEIKDLSKTDFKAIVKQNSKAARQFVIENGVMYEQVTVDNIQYRHKLLSVRPLSKEALDRKVQAIQPGPLPIRLKESAQGEVLALVCGGKTVLYYHLPINSKEQKALMSSGDGTENNPFCVICMDQEYDIINSLSPAMKVLRQRLLPGYIDCFECEENGVPRVVYFDISRWFERVKLF